MSKIIAGRFEQQAQVEQAITALLQAGFKEDQISSFYVNPPGQHNLFPIGGDEDKSSGAEESGSGMASGAMVGAALGTAAGLAGAPLLEPATAAVGTLVGAHIGSFIGALSTMHDDGAENEQGNTHLRKAGMIVAAAVTETQREEIVFEVLKNQGATEIESRQGNIIHGDWKDFDPLSPSVTLKH